MKFEPKTSRFLSQKDLQDTLDLINRALVCITKENLNQIINRMSNVVPFDFATCVFGNLCAEGIKEPYEHVNINFPSKWAEIYASKKFHEVDPIFKEHFKTFDIQLWENTYKKYNIPAEFINVSADFGLKKGFTHGARNYRNTKGSLFSFSGDSIITEKRTEYLLAQIIPHLHQALERALLLEKQKKKSLSKPELEVLQWFISGKTSWETSVIMGISERTVRFYNESLIQKLDAVSRTHAVAIALDLGLIELD